MSTSKDREHIEYLINQYKETVDILVDLRTQIWSKLDTDDEFGASVMARLNDITEKLAALSPKQNLDILKRDAFQLQEIMLCGFRLSGTCTNYGINLIYTPINLQP